MPGTATSTLLCPKGGISDALVIYAGKAATSVLIKPSNRMGGTQAPRSTPSPELHSALQAKKGQKAGETGLVTYADALSFLIDQTFAVGMT